MINISGRKKAFIVIAAVFLMAFAVRCFHLAAVRHLPETDEVEHDRLGVCLAEGKGYISTDDDKPTALRPPLYAAFLAVIYKLFGHSYIAVKLIQAFLGSMTVVFFYLIAVRIFGPPAAALTAIFTSFYMPFVSASVFLYNETLFNFLFALIVLIVVTGAGDLRPGRAMAVGILSAVLALTRATGLLMPLCCLIPFAVRVRAHENRRRFLAGAAVMLVFFALTLTPWIIRNYRVFGKFVPVSTNAGMNIYQGIRPVEGKIFGLGARDKVAQEAALIENEAQKSNFYVREAFRAYFEDPARAFKLIIMRYLFFLSPIDWEIMGGEVINYHFVFILPFAMAGFVIALARRKDILFLSLISAYYFGLVLIFQATPRYRLPIDGYLIMFGCYAAAYIITNSRRRLLTISVIAAYFLFTYSLYFYSIDTKIFLRSVMERLNLW